MRCPLARELSLFAELVRDLINRWGSVVVSRYCEKPVAVAGGIREPREKETSAIEATTKHACGVILCDMCTLYIVSYCM